MQPESRGGLRGYVPLRFKKGGEPEGGSLPEGALDLDLTLESRDDFPADREAQSQASGTACRGLVRLGEGTEKLGLFLRGYPDSRVLDLEAETGAIAGGGELRHPHDDMTALCELDGVVDQIYQNLI